MLKKKKKTQRDHGSLRYYSNSELMFDNSEYEISSILLELSNPVFIFPSDSPFLHKWGCKRKRSTSGSLKSPVISNEPVPVMTKSPPSMEVAEMGSTSSSSCLTGEAKKTNPQTVNKGLEEEFSTKQKISSDPNSVLKMETETRLSRAQVGLKAQPIKDPYQNLSYPQPVNMKNDEMTLLLQQARVNLERRDIDLNLPVAEEGNHLTTTMFSFQNVTTKVQAAAQARQRRLGLIRSKRFCSRFLSPYQYK